MPPSDSPTEAEAPDWASLPLYNTSYVLYHCSPLHLPRNTGVSEFRKSFPSHTRRFADHLQREARLGLSILGALDDNDALARAGALKQTTWTWVGEADRSEDESQNALSGPDGFGLTEGLQIVVEFERATYTALFLRRRSDADEDGDEGRESPRLRLPLLFFRMPTSLRGALLSYIAAHFDARADPVHIPGPRMADALENYLATIAPELQGDDDDEDATPSGIKDVQISLAFPDPALRSLDVAVPGQDVVQFLKLGTQTQRFSKANGTRDREKQGELATGPFTRSLAAYLQTHLALDVSHRDVHLARIACGGWALAREGRVKIFAPSPKTVRDVGHDVVEKLLEGVLDWSKTDGDEDVHMNGNGSG